MKDLYIVGAGSQSKYVIESCKEYRLKGLIDVISKQNIGKIINGIKIVCFLYDIEKYVDNKKAQVIVAYGDNAKKKEVVAFLTGKRFKFATIISNKAYISKRTEIGEGCIINPNVTIMPNTKIGNHVMIHSGSVIEHDNEIGDFVNIAPGVLTAGEVKIGEETQVYTGAIIIPRVKIGKKAIIGAGAVVLKNVPDNVTVVGVPARSIKRER
jgi:sugar O-acyltransferase (sialic acid O-acetyltransferase NeuD family)